MTNIIRKKIIVILGPTASGKTDLSLKLAKKFDGEIISADSRQVYRGLDIGSGKVRLIHDKAQGIRHYLIDVASPKRTFTVAQYKHLAQKAIKEILQKGKLPLVVGGTGFYIEALVYDLDFPEVKPNQRLRKELANKPAAELFKLLRKLDPARAKTIDKHNPRRLIRAIEIAKALGRVPQLRKQSKYEALFLGIKISDKVLREKISKRLAQRLPGIIHEIKSLRQQGISWQRLVSFGLEYRYISWYLTGKLSKAEAVAQLQTAIWQYGRRQQTWFRRLPVVWVNDYNQAIIAIQDCLL